MISEDFFSSENFHALKAVIEDNIKNDLKKDIQLDSIYEDGLRETMQYVSENVSQDVPFGMEKEDYLILMNKKVYSLITPVIKNDIKQSEIKTNQERSRNLTSLPKRNIQMNTEPRDNIPRNRIQSQQIQRKNTEIIDDRNNQKRLDPLFDPVLMENYDNVPGVIDYPKTADSKLKQDTMDQKLTEINDTRQMIYGKPSEIDFRDKNALLSDSKELMSNYNDLLKEYEKGLNIPKPPQEDDIMKDVRVYEPDNNKPFESIPIKIFEGDYEEDSYLGRNDYGGINKVNEMDIEGFKNKMKKDMSTENKNDYNKIYRYNSPDDPKALYNDIFIKEGINEAGNYTINQMDTKNMEFSPFNNTRLQSVIMPPKVNTIEKSYRIVVNSFDRNLEMFPDQNRFEIKFNPASNSYVVDAYVDSHNTLIYNSKQYVYGDIGGANIPISFDNIKEIKLIDLVSPVITNYRGGRAPVIYNGPSKVTGQTDFSPYDAVFTKSTGIPIGVFREPFLYLVVPELQHSYYTTGNIGRVAFAKLIPDYSANSGFVSVYTSAFTTLTPESQDEFYKYDPTLRGKVDKITPSVYNYHGRYYNFGIDKLFIKGITKAKAQRYDGYCGPEFTQTIVEIDNNNPNYQYYCSQFSVYQDACNVLNSHPVAPGDLIYFFNTLPKEEDVIFFEPYVKLTKLEFINFSPYTTSNIPEPPADLSFSELEDYYKEYQFLKDEEDIKKASIENKTVSSLPVNKFVLIEASYSKEVEECDGTKVVKDFPIVFRDFIPGGNVNNDNIYQKYYIALARSVPGHVGKKMYYYKIAGFKGNGVVVGANSLFEPGLINEFKEFGFVKANLQGYQNDDRQSLFFTDGYYVIRVGNFTKKNQEDTENVNPFLLTIDYPYNYIDSTLREDSPDYNFYNSSVFLIQHKLQLTYTFEIVVLTKDYDNMMSNLQGNGLNF